LNVRLIELQELSLFRASLISWAALNSVFVVSVFPRFVSFFLFYFPRVDSFAKALRASLLLRVFLSLVL